MKTVQLQLIQEDSAALAAKKMKPLNETSPVEFIQVGLDLEEQQ